jgi:hypothetical protein
LLLTALVLDTCNETSALNKGRQARCEGIVSTVIALKFTAGLIFEFSRSKYLCY